MFTSSESNGEVRFRVATAASELPPLERTLKVGEVIGRHASCALTMHHSKSPLVAACVRSRCQADPSRIETCDESRLVRLFRRMRYQLVLQRQPAWLLRHAIAAEGRLAGSVWHDSRAFLLALEDLEDAPWAHGICDDLIRPDGVGGYELFLLPEDRLVHKAQSGVG